VGQAFYGLDDEVMEYLLSFIATSLAIGLFYYRELLKKCKVQKENIRKNQHLWDNWGE
jgi:hypothetical protein